VLTCGEALAQTVGHGDNYQNPSAPNYKAPVVPAQPQPPGYELPPVPEVQQPTTANVGQMFVKHIEVRGVTVFKPAALAAVTAPYENRMVSSTDLQALRVALTRLYIDKGYINSGVVLPDQESKNGVVVYQAIEGALTRVEVGGKAKLRHRYVAARIRSHVDDPLNVNQLQYALRYLQQDPNVQRLDAALGPGDALGQSVLHVNVEEQPRFTAGIGVNNYQSSSIGATVGTVSFGFRDLTGWGEEFRGSVGHSRGDTLGSAVLTVPVNSHDGFVEAYFSRSSAAIIEKPFDALNIKETTRTYGINLTQPLIDTLENRFSLFAGLESNRSYTELLGTPFSFSPGAQNGVAQVTAVLGGIDWLVHRKSTVTDLRLTYRRGIDAMGATINNPSSINQLFNPNPTGADGRFGLEQLQFIHIARLNGLHMFERVNDRAQLIVRASGQLSQKPLLSLEKFTVGGVNTVRGFPENLLVRDNGFAATLELQLPLPGYKPQPGLGDLVFAPFIDYGRSWDKVNANPGNPLVDTSKPDYIAGAGVGLLWNPIRGLDAKIYWGREIADQFHGNNPLHYVPHDLQYHGIHFSLNYQLSW
jgi:hemolysin activation/secretion protein